MADNEVMAPVNQEEELKRVKEEKKKFKAEQKAQKKEAKRRAKELAAEEANIDPDSDFVYKDEYVTDIGTDYTEVYVDGKSIRIRASADPSQDGPSIRIMSASSKY